MGSFTLRNKLSEKSYFVLGPTPLVDAVPDSGILPMPAVLEDRIGTEMVALWVDKTPFMHELARLRPFNFFLKTGLVRTSHGPVMFLLFTVRELAEAAGTSDKTVRRDLILLRKVGFDLKETVGQYGRKSWRVGQRFEKLRSPRKQYKAILDTLDVLLAQVSLAGDQRLLGELQGIRRRVVRKCR